MESSELVNKYLKKVQSNHYMQSGGEVDMYGSPINAPIQRKDTSRSFYDSRRGVINVGTDFDGMSPEEQDELIAHENRHDWQYKNDRSNFEITHNPEYAFNERLQKKPNIVNTDEIFNQYHDRQQKETDLEIVNFKKRYPQFSFVPDQMLYDKGFVDNLYDNPNSLEGEAQYYQKTGERSFQKGGTLGSKSWDEQLERVRKEKASKPFPKLTVADLIAEKKLRDQNIGRQLPPQMVRDNTRVNVNNKPELISKVARNKTDKESAEERKYKIDQSIKAQKNSYTSDNWRQQLAAETNATGDKFRVSNEPNFFDDYLNPAVMVGSMASNLGQAPLQAEQSDSVLPYVTSIGAPLAVGALAGIGANSTGQFVNNLANPLAGTGDLVNNLGNKYLPNAYKLNPRAFKANPEAYYRKIGDEGLDDLVDSGVLRSKPNGNFVQEQPYFSKGLPMDGGRAGEFKIPAMKKMKYPGKYMAEAQGIPFNDVTGVTGQPINTIFKDAEGLNIYKEDWLKGYKQVEVSKAVQVEEMADLNKIKLKTSSTSDSQINLHSQSIPNPIAIIDNLIPRPLNPQSLIGLEGSWNDLSPLNYLPGYGKKLNYADEMYVNGIKNKGYLDNIKNQFSNSPDVGFRKFGNSIQDVIDSKTLRPMGSKFKIGSSQIKNEGNWAQPNKVNENYNGVFEATMNPNVIGSDIKLEYLRKRNGILGTTTSGNIEIPLTDAGLSFNRRLPFSNRYVPINKEKLLSNSFQLSTQLPHTQSLIEKYGLYAGLASGAGYAVNGTKGASEYVNTFNSYTVDPIIDKTNPYIKKIKESLINSLNFETNMSEEELEEARWRDKIIKDNKKYEEKKLPIKQQGGTQYTDNELAFLKELKLAQSKNKN